MNIPKTSRRVGIHQAVGASKLPKLIPAPKMPKLPAAKISTAAMPKGKMSGRNYFKEGSCF